MSEYSVKLKVYGKGEHICKKCFHYAVCTYQRSNNPIIECSHFVVERKHGKWIENKEESEKHIEPIFICSACENMEAWGYIEKNTYNFCPHCGADMSEAEDEDD